jgi:hypothetical protein
MPRSEQVTRTPLTVQQTFVFWMRNQLQLILVDAEGMRLSADHCRFIRS